MDRRILIEVRRAPCTSGVRHDDGDLDHLAGARIGQVATTRYKVRTAGIDAPERDQPYGAESTENLFRLIAGKRVTVEWTKKDRYGRIVGKILVGDRDICLEQVRAGYAWHYKKYQREQSPEDRELYAQAEKQARLAKRGLWSVEGAVAPWEWRKR